MKRIKVYHKAWEVYNCLLNIPCPYCKKDIDIISSDYQIDSKITVNCSVCNAKFEVETVEH